MQRSGRIRAAVLTGVLAAAPVCGQGRPSGADSGSEARDASRSEIPVSLERIRRELAASQPRTTEARKGLRLEYYVEVFGKAPDIELFIPQTNLTTAPVMYGGMTHQEFISLVTPEEFRSPPADIGGAIAALIKWAAERKKNSSPQR
jgi:hypothetical protein